MKIEDERIFPDNFALTILKCLREPTERSYLLEITVSDI